MKTLIDPKTMRACEEAYFRDSCVPSIEIMENAARLLCDTIIARIGAGKTAYFACGPGGNGGDGYACARMYAEAGGKCVVFASAPAKSADAVANAARCLDMGIEILSAACVSDYSCPEIWVDAIYGTGLSREPDEDSAYLIRRMNRDRAFGSKTVSADIPSGLRGDTGIAYAACVEADITVAFHFPKYGHYLNDGLDVCGDVVSKDIGFPDDIFPNDLPHLCISGDLGAMFLKRKCNSYKGKYGHLLIIAGSFGMAGAAALCAKAALRSGVGLVSIACPQSIVTILQTLAPCAMCIPLPEESCAISADALPLVQEALKGKTAAAIGPGLTQKVPEEIVRCVLESEIPAVIDADAINIIAKSEALKSLLADRHILTPHPGEAARLIGHKINDPVSDAKEIAALGANVVLKGASRVIASSKTIFLSAAGASGMARGGSGDVFTGILGAVIAASDVQKPAYSAVLPMLAAAAAEIHGLAGELAQKKYGAHAMNSADIIEFLPEVFKTYVE